MPVQWDDRLLRQSLTRDYPRIIRGEGHYLIDDQGRRYTDGASGGVAPCNIVHGVKSLSQKPDYYSIIADDETATDAAKDDSNASRQSLANARRVGGAHPTVAASRKAPGTRERPPISPQVRNLIRIMSQADALWGVRRTHGELLKLGSAECLESS